MFVLQFEMPNASLKKRKKYAAFDMYKLIAQWTTKVDMTNMYKIRKEFTYHYYVMVTSAI